MVPVFYFYACSNSLLRDEHLLQVEFTGTTGAVNAGCIKSNTWANNLWHMLLNCFAACLSSFTMQHTHAVWVLGALGRVLCVFMARTNI